METVDFVNCSQQLEEKLLENKCLTCLLFEAHFEQEHRRRRLSEEVRHLQRQLSQDSLAFMPDYRNHVLALERLGYVEPSGTLTLKRHVARSLSSHEVMLTELLLQESLLTLVAPEVAGLFFCFVYEQRSNSEPVVPRSMKAHFAHIMQLTVVQEGIIVRCIQRLDELLKDFKTAVGIVGNPELRAMPMSAVVFPKSVVRKFS
ncbi:superkiller complex protein 2-like [Amblyomma americanum]